LNRNFIAGKHLSHASCHFQCSLTGNSAKLQQGIWIHLEQKPLRLVSIGSHAAKVIVRSAWNIGNPMANQTPGARFGDCQFQPALP
jgi:hypothetical protein